MNKQQIISMWIGIFLFIVVGLFPPFIDSRLARDGIYLYRGHHFYLVSNVKVLEETPMSLQQGGVPKIYSFTLNDYRRGTTYPVKIDYYRLQLQLLLLVVLTIGMIITASYSLKLIKTIQTDKLEI